MLGAVCRVRRSTYPSIGTQPAVPSNCRHGFVVRLLRVELLPSALKHGIAAEDIEHAVRQAMVIEDLDDDLRLYLGPGRSGALLEIISVLGEQSEDEFAIHAMGMRSKYRRLIPGGEA